MLLGLWSLAGVYGRLGGDGYQYYMLLRSPLVDGDLDFANDYQGLGTRPLLSAEGEPTNRYPFGVPLLWAPAVLAVHAAVTVASWLGAPVVADGFSPAYQSAATSTTFVYAFAALLLLEGLLRRLYGPAVALLTVVGIWLATPLHFYMVANPFMSHGLSVFAATAFVLGWLRARQQEGLRSWALVGLAGALMSLVRVQDGLLLALPLLDLAWKRRRDAWRPALAILAAPAVLWLLQVVLWLRIHGSDFAERVAGYALLGRSSLHVMDLLFASRHGLLTWTPLYLPAILGLLLWLRREARLALLFLLGLALAVVMNAAMEDWWGSDAFGQRRMLGLTAIFALGLGEAIAWLRRRPLLAVAGVFAGLVAWNLQFEYIFNSEMLAGKGGAITLDRLADAQVETFYRRALRLENSLPRPVWFFAYDNLKGVWLDEGPRSLRGIVDLGQDQEPPDLPMIVGHNWYGPEIEEGIGFRRTRARRSWLRVPIRTPGDFEVVLKARSEMREIPLRVALEVNGQVAGETPLSPEWTEQAFRVPASMLRSGFNEVALLFSTSPRLASPDQHGKDAAAAVDSLRWTREGRP